MKTCCALGQTLHTGGARQRGSFLLEVALVLVAVGALTVATFEAQSAWRQRQQQAGAKNIVMAVDAAVRKFVARDRRLPCPANGASGVEARGAGGCTSPVGSVPYATLGMELPSAPGGLTLRYGVTVALAQPGSEGLMKEAIELAEQPDDGGSTAAPYLAGPDANGMFANCGSVATNPAYVLMWRPPAGAGVPSVPPLCFRESADGSMGVHAVGGLEFLGWLQSAMRAH